MDDDILKTVHSIFGKGVKIVDCEKTTSVREEELLCINGIPVQLDGMPGDDANAIKEALLTGKMPSMELLNQLLYQASILQQPVQLETSFSVKSSTVTTEEVSVSRDGRLLDERTRETKEDHIYQSNNKEIWQPRLEQNIQKITKKPHNLGSTKDLTTNDEDKPAVAYPICLERRRRDNTSLENTSFSIDSDRFEDSSNDIVLMSGDHKLQRDIAASVVHGNIINLGTLSSLATTISNYSSYPSESSMTTDYSSTYSNSSVVPNAMLVQSNLNVSSTQILDERVLNKKSNISNDSGHDDILHSISHSATAAGANSLSSNCDLVSNGTDESTESVRQENAYQNSTTQRNVVFLEKIAKNHVDLQALNDIGQMLPLSNSVNSGSFGNVSASSVCKPFNVKSTPTKGSNNIDLASSQQSNKGSRKCYQYIKPQTSLVQQQNESVPVASKEAMIHTTSNPKTDNLLVYCDGNLISGSLEALIHHMVPTCNYYPDSTFVFSFLLSARLFIRPHELLCKISESWEQQHKSRGDVVDNAKVDNHKILLASPGSPAVQRKPKVSSIDSNDYKDELIQTSQVSAHNCIRLLAEWIETFPYDFRDERLMQQVRILARKCVYIDNALGKQVSKILQMLVQRLTVLEKYEEFLQSLTAAELNAAEPQLKCYVGVGATTAYNPLGRNVTTPSSAELSTIHKSITTNSSIHLLPSSLSTCANTNSKSLESFSHHTENPNHIHSHTEFGQTNVVNLTLHHLSGHFSNNSHQSINDVHGIMDMCSSPAQLAHQLTTIELERLSHIGLEEFVQAFAKEYNHPFVNQPASIVNSDGGATAVLVTTSLSDIKKTRNLESYVEWFNRLSYLTATEIVKYSKKKQRVRVIEHWIETACECFNIGNFNSLMAIIAGLNLAPILRLKKTWSKVQSAKFSVLEHQMDPSSNFNSYRSTLKAAMWRSEGATNECERIIIPFFSLFVKDLYFLNEGCSNRLPNNHINFEKCAQLSKQVMEFNEWKKVACPFEKLPNVIKFLQSSVVLNENTLSIASFECEPPENTHEKGRYKTLKSETKLQQQIHEQQNQH